MKEIRTIMSKPLVLNDDLFKQRTPSCLSLKCIIPVEGFYGDNLMTLIDCYGKDSDYSLQPLDERHKGDVPKVMKMTFGTSLSFSSFFKGSRA